MTRLHVFGACSVAAGVLLSASLGGQATGSGRGNPVSAGSPRSEGRPNTSPQAGTSRPEHSARYWRQATRGQYKARRRAERANAILRRQLDRTTRRLWRTQRQVRASSTLVYTPRYAIHLAAVTYGVDEGEMLRVAQCESQMNPYSKNPSSSASGLMQFLTTPNGGTWGRTPYGGFDVYDPVPNALAAAWLVRQDGGWSEWSCGWAAR